MYYCHGNVGRFSLLVCSEVTGLIVIKFLHSNLGFPAPLISLARFTKEAFLSTKKDF